MKTVKPYWEGWHYIIAYSINGSFDSTTETNKRNAISIAKQISRENKAAEVYVYRTYITASWEHSKQTTIYQNDNFAAAYGR